jgi:hypothetical protein
MTKLKQEIKEIRDEHPEWETVKKTSDTPFIEGDLPELYAKLGITESDFGKKAEVFDVSDDP